MHKLHWRHLPVLCAALAGALAGAQPTQNTDGAQLLQSGARQWSGGVLLGSGGETLKQAGYSTDGLITVNGDGIKLQVEPLGVDLAPLLLISPAAGESWELGSTHTLHWTSIGAVGDLKFRLYKGGVFQRWLGGVVTNDGDWDWSIQTDLVPGNDYRMVVHSTDYQYLDVSAGTFSLVAGPLALVAPNGGETWELGSAQNVSWIADAPTGSLVKFRLLQNNAFSTIVSGEVNNTGSWQWNLSPALKPGVYRLLAYTPDYQYLDQTDASFTLAPGPLELTAPNTAVTWARGSTQTVTWNAEGATGATVKFKLYHNGVLDRSLTGAQANDGTWDWTIPNDLPDGGGYRILIYTPDYQFLDMSDVTFDLS